MCVCVYVRVAHPQIQGKHREQINEPLGTGVKALDLLTPVGRGACLLVVGPHRSGKSCLAEDVVMGQKDTGEAGNGT